MKVLIATNREGCTHKGRRAIEREVISFAKMINEDAVEYGDEPYPLPDVKSLSDEALVALLDTAGGDWAISYEEVLK